MAVTKLLIVLCNLRSLVRRPTRNLLANLSRGIEFKRDLPDTLEPRCGTANVLIQPRVTTVKPILVAPVGTPSHPLWLRRKMPFVWIEVCDQTYLDLLHHAPCLIGLAETLRSVRN